jgi:hypothetical protein
MLGDALMTWYKKQKQPKHGSPERCFRCGTRLGKTQLDVVNTSSAPKPAGGALWVCEDCRAEIGPEDASTN